VPVLNPLGILKSLFTFNRPWAHLRPLIQALRTRPYDLAALAEKAQTRPGEATTNWLIDEIVRSVTWEVQSRSMRGV